MRILALVIAAYLLAAPARAGTIVCVLYAYDGEVQAIYIPDDNSACNHLHDGPLNQVRFPLAMFGAVDPKTQEGAMAIAWQVQHLVPALVRTADAAHR